MPFRRFWPLLIAAALAFTLIGCSSSPRRDPGIGGGGGFAAPARDAHDPPLRFDTSSAITLPAEASDSRITLGGDLSYPLPVALNDLTAFIGAPEGMMAVHTESGGEIIATFPPVGEPLERSLSSGWVGGSTTAAPVVGETDGRVVVLTAYTTRHAGVGTQRSRRYTEIIEVDARTLKQRWAIKIEIPDEMSPYSGPISAAIVGILPGRAAVQVSQDKRHDLHIIDLNDGRTVWSRANHGPSTVAGEVVVTVVDKNPDLAGSSLVGLAGADGHELWSDNSYGEEIEIKASGGGVVAVSGSSGNLYLRMVDPADGAIKAILEQERTLSSTRLDIKCFFDQRTSIACSLRERWLSVFDTTTKKWLWDLPDDEAGRVAPEVNFAWHGAVYGETRDGPVVLDAATGEDREINPGITAYLVNQFIGIGPSPRGTGVAVFRPVG